MALSAEKANGKSLAKKPDLVRMTQLGILIALEAVLAFTPLGMIQIPPISITTMHIPVIIAAVLLGPTAGGILGGTFGVCAMIRAIISGTGLDIYFNPAASGNPLGTIIMCVVTRILLGLVAGFVYLLLKKLVKNDLVAIPVTAVVGTVVHTLTVLLCLWFFFRQIPLAAVFTTIIAVNGLVEICAAVVLSTAICKPLMTILKKRKRA